MHSRFKGLMNGFGGSHAHNHANGDEERGRLIEQRELIHGNNHNHIHGHHNHGHGHHDRPTVKQTLVAVKLFLMSLWNPLVAVLAVCCLALAGLCLTMYISYPKPPPLPIPFEQPQPWRGELLLAYNQSQSENSDSRVLLPRVSLHSDICKAHYPTIDPRDLPPPTRSYRYFLAANLFNNEAIIPDFIQELHRLLAVLCSPNILPSQSQSSTCTNIFVSIYESGSTDQTRKELIMLGSFLRDLRIAHSIVTGGEIVKAKGLYRIDHLTAVRNAAIAPFFELHANIHNDHLLYDRIVWLNDVLFCAEDVLRLISHSEDGIQMVCGLDFYEHQPEIAFYDTWVMRGLDGTEPVDGFPWFKDREMIEGMLAMETFPVFCCWNGLLVMSAQEWLEYGIGFRSHDLDTVSGAACDASECSHICEAYWAIHHADTHVLVDPLVNVAFRHDVYGQIRHEPWFDSEARHRVWTPELEAQLQRRVRVPHTNVTSWECRDLDFRYAQHNIEFWSDKQKRQKKKQFRRDGWMGFDTLNITALIKHEDDED